MADKIRGYSFGGKHYTGKVSSSPGPGDYSLAPVGIEKRPVAFGTGPSRIRSVSASETDKAPGPGAYLASKPWDCSGTSYTMGAKNKEQRQQNPVGPGAYTPKSQIERLPAYSFRPSHKKMNTHSSGDIGPGAYDPNYRSASSNASFGTAISRPGDKIPSYPGAGSYSVAGQVTDGPKFGFGSSARIEEVVKAQNPGPGDYTTKQRVVAEAPKVTMLPRRRVKLPTELVPGPGAYVPEKRTKAPRAIMTTSQRHDFTKNTASSPGPGSYSPAENVKQTNSIYLSKSARITDNSGYRTGSLPAPGDYETAPKRREGPSFTMRPKNLPQDRKATLPAPGQYSPTSNNDKRAIGGRIPRGRFNTLEHGPSFEDVPGPGTYESGGKTDQSGPQYGFGSERRLAEQPTEQKTS